VKTGSVQGTSEMKRLYPEADHQPTSIGKVYGRTNLQFFSPSACSLEKSGFRPYIKTEVLFYFPYRNLISISIQIYSITVETFYLFF